MLWRHSDIIKLIFEVISVIWDSRKYLHVKPVEFDFILLTEVKNVLMVLQTVTEMQNDLVITS